MALDKILLFQYGKILLASVSLSELTNMRTKDYPYVTNLAKDLDQCLSGTSCQGVQDLVGSLGGSNPSGRHIYTARPRTFYRVFSMVDH